MQCHGIGALGARIAGGFAAGLAGLAGVIEPVASARPTPSRPVRRNVRAVGVPAGINRHTGRPHEHKREIARRERQAEQYELNRIARGDFSGSRTRRGRPVNIEVTQP